MPIEWDLNRRIAVRNLGESATKSEILLLFGKYGKINKLWVARNPPGFAFLEYKSRRDAETAARQLNGKRCCGCYITVDLTNNLPLDSNPRHSRRGHEPRRRSRRQRLEACVNSRSPSRTYERQRRESVLSNEPTSTSRFRSRRSRPPKQLEVVAERRTRSMTNETQRLDCIICFDNIINREPNITPCGHVFCSSCIRKALKINRKCPVCQTNTLENQLQPIYLNP